jgi:biopolymer transport protein ExbD
MKFKPRRELKKTRIEIIPMIDTMFFLLVFFMLSSLSLTKMYGMKVELPHAGTVAPKVDTPLSLSISRDQRLSLNGVEVSPESLASSITEVLRSRGVTVDDASVLIQADAAVAHGVVVDAIDRCQSAGLKSFSIATTPRKIP